MDRQLKGPKNARIIKNPSRFLFLSERSILGVALSHGPYEGYRQIDNLRRVYLPSLGRTYRLGRDLIEAG